MYSHPPRLRPTKKNRKKEVENDLNPKRKKGNDSNRKGEE